MLKIIEKRLRQSSYQTHDSIVESTPKSFQVQKNKDLSSINNTSQRSSLLYSKNPIYTHRYSVHSNDRKASQSSYQQSEEGNNDTPININTRIRNISQFKQDVENLNRNRNQNNSLLSQAKDSARTQSQNKYSKNDAAKINLLEEIQSINTKKQSTSTNYTPINNNRRSLIAQNTVQSPTNSQSFTQKFRNSSRGKKFLLEPTDRSLSKQTIDISSRAILTQNTLKQLEPDRVGDNQSKNKIQINEYNDESTNRVVSNQSLYLDDKQHLSSINSNFSTCTSKQSYMNLIFNESARTMNQGNFQDYLTYLNTQSTLNQKSKVNQNRKSMKEFQSTIRQRKQTNDLIIQNTANLSQIKSLRNLPQNSQNQLNKSEKDLNFSKVCSFVQHKDVDDSVSISPLTNQNRFRVKLNKIENDLSQNKKDQLSTIDTLLTPILSQSSTQKIKTLINIPSISIIETKKNNLIALKPIEMNKIKGILDGQKLVGENKSNKQQMKDESPNSKTVQFMTSIQNIEINDDLEEKSPKISVQKIHRPHKRHNTFGSSPLITQDNAMNNRKDVISEKTDRPIMRNQSLVDIQIPQAKKASFISQLKALNFAQKLIHKKDVSKQTQKALNCLEKMLLFLKQITTLPKIFHNKTYNFLYDLWSRFPDLRKLLLDKEKQFLRTPLVATSKIIFDLFSFEKLKNVYELDPSKFSIKITYDYVLEKYLIRDLNVYNTFIQEFSLKLQQVQLRNLEKSIIDQQNTINNLEQKMSQNLLCNPNQSQTTSITYNFKQDYNNNIKSALERGTFLFAKQAEKFEIAEKKYGNFDDITLNQKYFGSYIQKIYENIRKNKMNQNKFASKKEEVVEEEESFT